METNTETQNGTNAGGTGGGNAASSGQQSNAGASNQANSSQGNGSGFDWKAGLDGDLRGFAENKGFKDVAGVVDSYRNLEKLLGAKEKLIKLPEKPDAPEWNDIYNKLGRPEKPTEYGVKFDKQIGDDNFTNEVLGKFHELGLTRAQAEKLSAFYSEKTLNSINAHKEAASNKAKEEDAALKKEWGAAYESQMAMAKKAAAGFGMKPEVIEAIEKAGGYAEVMKFMHSVGAKMGEDSFVSGGKSSSFGVLTPAAAQNRISALKMDPDFAKRLASGGVKEREEWNKLHEFAYSSN